MADTWATVCWRARHAPWLSQVVAGDSCGRTGIGRSGGDSRRSCGCTWLQSRCVCAPFADWSDDCPSKRKMQETDTEAAAEAATGAEAAAAAAAEAINIEMEIEKGIENYR